MNVGRVGMAVGAAALLWATASVSAAPASGPWLHVRVEEAGRQAKVAVNLPISAVEAALKAAPDTVVADGRLKLGHHGKDISVSDLRRMWNALKATGDAELVSVEEDDQRVRIARAGDLVLIHVDKPSNHDSVRVEVPVDVVDALLSGAGEELDIRAAFAQLQKRRGDIVRVKDDDSTVRIWIDEGN